MKTDYDIPKYNPEFDLRIPGNYEKLLERYNHDVEELNRQYHEQQAQKEEQEKMKQEETYTAPSNIYDTGGSIQRYDSTLNGFNHQNYNQSQYETGYQYNGFDNNYNQYNNYPQNYNYQTQFDQQYNQQYGFNNGYIDPYWAQQQEYTRQMQIQQEMQQSMINNPYGLRTNPNYSQEDYLRDFQYGWNLYHDQYGNNLAKDHYVYNGAYVNIPQETKQTYAKYIPGVGYVNQDTGTVIGSAFGDSGYNNYNNYQGYQNYNNYNTGYNTNYGFYDYNYYQMELARQEELKQMEEYNRSYYKLMYYACTGKSASENEEDFEEFYQIRVHPEANYYNNQQKVDYVTKYGFVGTEEERAQFNKYMEQQEPVQQALYRIDYIIDYEHERFDRFKDAVPNELKKLYAFEEGFQQIIPEEKKGKCTLKELGSIYLPRMFAYMDEFDRVYDYTHKPLNQRYSSKDYKKLLEYHRRNPNNMAFNPEDALNGREIHVPDYLKQEREIQDRRKRFVQSVYDMKSNINKGALF